MFLQELALKFLVGHQIEILSQKQKKLSI